MDSSAVIHEPRGDFGDLRGSRWTELRNAFDRSQLRSFLGRSVTNDNFYYRKGLSDLFPICGIIASDPQEAHRR